MSNVIKKKENSLITKIIWEIKKVLFKNTNEDHTIESYVDNVHISDSDAKLITSRRTEIKTGKYDNLDVVVANKPKKQEAII